MLLASPSRERGTSVVVWAYDIGCPRRARAARSILYPLHSARQYSVIETSLSDPCFRGVLAEVSTALDPSSDLLAIWWPNPAFRIAIEPDRLVTVRMDEPRYGDTTVSISCGNFVVCYDICDDDRRDRIAEVLASTGTRLQRSVYWLRVDFPQALALLSRCREHVTSDDRIWAYPIRSCDRLWRFGARQGSLFPTASHRWNAFSGAWQ